MHGIAFPTHHATVVVGAHWLRRAVFLAFPAAMIGYGFGPVALAGRFAVR